MAIKRILFVIPTAYPLGGVAVWLNYIVQGLSGLDWDIYVGAVNGKYHKAEDYLKEYPFDKVMLITDVSATRYGRVIAISKAIREINADIVLSVNIPDVFDAVSDCKNKGHEVKSVMTLHALEADYFQDISSHKCNIDAVVTTNRLTKLMVAEASKYSNNRVFYAPYGVKTDIETCYAELSDRIVLLYAGRLEHQQKRCGDLLLLVKKLEEQGINYELQIAGDGPMRDDLIPALIAESKIGLVSYLGQLNNREFNNKVLPAADFLVLVSEWETGPIIIWEAMAAGVVVLSSRYIGSGVEDALIDGENCLMFDTGNIDQLVDHVKNIRNPEMIYSLKKQAYKLVESRYSHAASINAWDSVLKSVMNDIEAKLSTGIDTKDWAVRGRIEKTFGHKLAYRIRRYLGFSAHKNSAGDEWPHGYSEVNSEQQQEFLETMYSLESK